VDCDRPGRNARITISLSAIAHNLKRCRQLVKEARVFAVIKADAYGHGAVEVLPALAQAHGLAVVTVAEGLTIREHCKTAEILILQGANSHVELSACLAGDLSVVVHDRMQIELFRQSDAAPLRCWLKVDTGMGRLGFSLDELDIARARLEAAHVEIAGLLTHLACADDRDHPMTAQQLQNFTRATTLWPVPPLRSVANSAAVLSRDDAALDWVRPGLMLYGASPFAGECAAQYGLQAAMRVEAPVISVRNLKRGQSVGYGATFVCPGDMQVALVGIGYGDGYPRAAGTGTPVQIGGRLCPLLGRVSMDSIAVDVSSLGGLVQPGEVALLWGSDELPVERLSECVGMIPYELLCTIRGERRWLPVG